MVNRSENVAADARHAEPVAAHEALYRRLTDAGATAPTGQQRNAGESPTGASGRLASVGTLSTISAVKNATSVTEREVSDAVRNHVRKTLRARDAAREAEDAKIREIEAAGGRIVAGGQLDNQT